MIEDKGMCLGWGGVMDEFAQRNGGMKCISICFLPAILSFPRERYLLPISPEICKLCLVSLELLHL